MTNRDWKKLRLPMDWSIFVGRYRERPEDFNDWDLDLSTDAPDGEWPVTTTYKLKGGKKNPVVNGVKVVDGHFVPEPTARACYKVEALCCAGVTRALLMWCWLKPEIAHRFIEQMTWDADNRRFLLRTAS